MPNKVHNHSSSKGYQNLEANVHMSGWGKVDIDTATPTIGTAFCARSTNAVVASEPVRLNTIVRNK